EFANAFSSEFYTPLVACMPAHKPLLHWNDTGKCTHLPFNIILGDKKVDKQDNITQALFNYMVEEAEAPFASTSGTSKTSKMSNLPEPEIDEWPQKDQLDTSKLPESIEPISMVINAPPKEADSLKPINETPSTILMSRA
ncbi:19461_t:CDS:2, partial [Gigaspora rosea]